MLLISNGEVFAPESLGKMDILLAGGKIVHLAAEISPSHLPCQVEQIDAHQMAVVPGFVDGHQHFTGGGGEAGFHTKTPEMRLAMNFASGITTAIGLLGTDALTRSIENLYAKTEAFNNEGLTALMLTGSYWYPPPTLTGSAARDLTFIKPVIGMKLALADTRGPFITAEQLATIASELRVAALIAGKPGVITVHTGVKRERLTLIEKVVNDYGLRADMFIATHINRQDSLLAEQVFRLAARGMTADATCRAEIPPADAPQTCAADYAMGMREQGLFDRLTFSSDAGGSLPIWDADRKQVLGMGIGDPASMLFELHRLVNHFHLDLATALQPVTTTPATLYGLGSRKGRLRQGYDGDLVILDPATMQVRDVVAAGRLVTRDGEVVARSYFPA